MRKLWNKTLNKSAENNIFLTWEKMAPSINQIENENSIKIICATENNKLIGIAPFRKTKRSIKGKLSYTIIEPLTNGDTDYTGIILAKQEKRVLNKFLAYLFNQKDWDLLLLPDLPQNSQTLKLLKQTPKELPKSEIQKGIICPYINIPDSKEELLARLRPSFRKRLQRCLRKLEREQGKVELKHFQEIGSLEHAMKLLFELHQKRWISKGGSGRFAKQRERDISRQTAKYFAEKGWLKLYFLTVNNKPIAAELDLEYKGELLFHFKGWDPQYSKFNVGHILLEKVLEECIFRGITEYDFMQGDEPYKFYWTNKYRQNRNIIYVNKKFSAITIWISLTLYKLVNHSLGLLKNRILKFSSK